ncbi:phage tail protein [Pedosphaera parvula]|uniref:Tail Collar domain protein n=1 Tax=Pedosphaera parvula (strain Ellin514) TaxID=320771 RepID=B9XBK4_PEDPL|nr:tail fiber protein [Pedosphaera parvula]EEF62889.1 Tail Collar domain protein [Pedosphaera parvula Ellin514]
MATPYVSEIKMFAGSFPPQGWMLCQGQMLPIAQYEVLYALIGTTYGGDGQTTFALPDLRGRVPIHFGQSSGTSNYVQGGTQGVEQVTITSNQMPIHNHAVNCNSAGTNQALVATQTTPINNFPGTESTGAGIYETTSNSTMNAGMIGINASAQPHENRQPFLTVNFIIAFEGVFPSRS